MSDRVEFSFCQAAGSSPYDASALLAEKTVSDLRIRSSQYIEGLLGQVTFHNEPSAGEGTQTSAEAAQPSQNLSPKDYQSNSPGADQGQVHGPHIDSPPRRNTPPEQREDPSLPGLPPPSGGHRQIVHIEPGRYIDIPYPADYSVSHGVIIGHVTIQLPHWIPGGHPWSQRR